MTGTNKKLRIKDMWQRIQLGYAKHPTESKLDHLTEKMLSKDKPSAKLKAHAAETRALIPIINDLVHSVLDGADPMSIDATVIHASHELGQCYACLSADYPHATREQDLATHCRKFCSLWVALEDNSDRFRVKPNMHLFQELCEFEIPGSPARTWTYRDEDFGGSMAQLGKRRGGCKKAGTIGTQILNKFCCRFRLPDFL